MLTFQQLWHSIFSLHRVRVRGIFVEPFVTLRASESQTMNFIPGAHLHLHCRCGKSLGSVRVGIRTQFRKAEHAQRAASVFVDHWLALFQHSWYRDPACVTEYVEVVDEDGPRRLRFDGATHDPNNSNRKPLHGVDELDD